MNTKDLIKRMGKSQDVKPMQLLTKTVVEPTPMFVDVIAPKESETVEECVERTIKPETEHDALTKQLDTIIGQLQAVTVRCQSIQDALELLLAEHVHFNERIEKLEARLLTLETKPSFLKRIFKWR